ncbi:MAG: YhcH/YjgK/YiaL family protein [bacterium]
MILDKIENSGIYCSMHPVFKRAFDFLARKDLMNLDTGRNEIDGEKLFAVVVNDDGKGLENAKLEVHRKYIDIQYSISGVDIMGWKPASDCSQWESDFETDKDLGFFKDRPAVWLSLYPGHFAVFFPDDAHAPMGGKGKLNKIVIKILI